MHDPFDISTIVFALLAIFVVWKLRSVLGSRTGNERPPSDPFQRSGRGEPRPGPAPGDGKVIPLPGTVRDPVPITPPDAGKTKSSDRWTSYAEPGSKVWEGLDAIAAVEPAFDPEHFLAGAKAAYEMIVVAFAAGDRQTLRSLLAKDVLDSFEGAITQREERGEKIETTLVSIDKATIDDAQLRGRTAQISVRFCSKLITATKDRSGKIIEGSPDTVVDMVDVWTFAHDAGARDPNWKLVATGPGH
jgi:predicted lipid-binding transport protein (Tim44 family)